MMADRHDPGQVDDPARSSSIRRVLWRVLWLNLLVATTKLTFGLMSGAISMVADGIHSFLDSASNVVGLVGSAIAARPPDPGHPYGHRKFEVLAALGITFLLGVASYEILIHAARRLIEGVPPRVTTISFVVMIVTMLIKLLFYKLSETSGHSMARMRKLQPRIKHLQERYKDDRQALSQAMMELYKKEKVNPAAGCLPMLVQMPVFLAFYWVLLESVELRQAPFMLWIQDLSSRDPYFILPILMGVSMLGQQKLNPAPPDPVQAKIMMLMPVVFTVFFAFFPAGLVLYWFVNTLLSIAQQWRINKVTDAAK